MSDCENLDPGAGARGGDDKANEEEQPIKSKPLSVSPTIGLEAVGYRNKLKKLEVFAYNLRRNRSIQPIKT